MANVAELIVKITADTKDAQQGVDDVATKSSKMKGAIQGAALPAAAALAAVGAAAVGAANAAADDAQQQAILANTMDKTTGASGKQIAAMEDYITKMSEASGVADDELRPAMGKLLRATGDAEESQKAMASALDISAATGKDVGSVSDALAKAYGGSTGSLKKLVPSLDDATLKSGNMKKIMKELSDQTGGASAAAADTAAGKMKKMQNSMGEAQEEIGTALLPMLAKFADVMAEVAGWISENSTLFLVIAGTIAVVAAAIIVLNAGIAVYQAVMIVAGAVSGAAWLAALWPILLVIAAIAAVVIIIVILWKKSETFRDIVLGVWGAIKGGVIALKNAAVDAWQAMLDKVRGIVDAIKNTFSGMKDRVLDIVEATKQFVQDKFAAMKDKASDIVDAIKGFFGGLKDKVVEIAGNIKDFYAGKFDDIKNKAQDIVAGIKQFFVDMWANIKDNIPAGLAETLAKPFNVAKDAVNAMKDAIGFVITKVESLINWLSKIKVPKINLPGGGGDDKSTRVAVPSVAGFAAPAVASPRVAAPSHGGGVHITVNGALDPEATARQIRRILAGHDRRVGLAS